MRNFLYHASQLAIIRRTIFSYSNVNKGRVLRSERTIPFPHRKATCGSSAGSQDNLTAVLYGINDLRLEQRPVPKPKEGEVLLRIETVGICGSDVHFWVKGRIGPFIVKKPMVIGHEASGTVLEIGKGVKNVAPGDRVAIEPGYGCRKCWYCRTGKYNLCPDMAFCATPPIDGNLTRYYLHAADFCFKLPDNVSFDEGALAEPISVGLHACNRGCVQAGAKVLVVGAGTIGLVTLLSAKAYGASKVVITDVNAHRLKVAKELGADITIQVKKGESEQEVAKKVVHFLCDQPDVSLETSGSLQGLKLVPMATKAGGIAVLVGMAATQAELSLEDVIFREVDVRGVFRYVNCYPPAIALMACGKIKAKPLITHHFRMEQTKEAFEVAKTGKDNAIKVQIHPNPDWTPC